MPSRSDAGRGRPRHSRSYREPRLFYRRGWFAADLRPWGLGRPTLRDPNAPGWPDAGDRTDSETVARRWLPEYIASVRRIHMRQRVMPRRLVAAWNEFAQHRQTTIERSTQGQDRVARGHLLDFLGGDVPVLAVVQRLQGFVDHLGHRGYAPNTIISYYSSVASFLRWASLPVPEVELPASPQSEARFWDDGELARLRESADYVGARLALELAFGTGARQQELFALTWQRLNATERSVRIALQIDRDRHRTKPLKGKRARAALVLPPFWSYLDAAVPDWNSRVGLILPGKRGGFMARTPQEQIMREVLTGARLREPDVGWHACRHTYGRLVLEGGGSLEQLRTYLGHRSIRTTEEIYGHLTEQAAIRLGRERIFGTAS